MVTSVAPNLQARLLHSLPRVNGALQAEGIGVVPIRMAWGKNHKRQFQIQWKQDLGLRADLWSDGFP